MHVKCSDYKDMRGIYFERSCNDKKEDLAVERLWQIVLNNEFKASKEPITVEEFLKVPRLFITHVLDDMRPYTEYSFEVEPCWSDREEYVHYCRQHNCRIDRKHKLIVLESTRDNRVNTRDEDLSFPKLRRMMISHYTQLTDSTKYMALQCSGPFLQKVYRDTADQFQLCLEYWLGKESCLWTL